MVLSEKLISNLKNLNLDPILVESIARQAIAEDLAGGEDVTSQATIPAGQQSIAEFVTRKPGVIAGLNIAAAVLEWAGRGRRDRGSARHRCGPGLAVLRDRGRSDRPLLGPQHDGPGARDRA